ncbi:MAG: Uncharacterized protein Athens071425_275 [Parcubacteria group bacterium Athens0714_25]|nr:MAG: Uncharacterized protein Athens071425_275 [Parcubacteria group bacterium Athens0714_25]
MLKEREKVNSDKVENKEKNLFSIVSLAWELGYTIAIPLIFFALLGRFLDRKLESSPWMFLAGVVFSIVISVYLVYKKTEKIIQNQ